MKIIIAGRTGTGKTTLAQRLSEYGYSVMKSYTTRKPRNENEDSYIFVTDTVAEKMTSKILSTNINGNEYFATDHKVKHADILILDPAGITEITERYPDEEFVLIYVRPIDLQTASELAAKRENDFEDGLKLFHERYSAEDERFTELEKKIDDKQTIANNIKVRFKVINDFTDLGIENTISRIIGELKTIEHMGLVLRQLVRKDLIDGDDDGMLARNPATNEQRRFSYDTMAIVTLSSPERFAETMRLWLSLYNPLNAEAPLPECDSETCIYCNEYGRCTYERTTGLQPVISEDFETGCSGFTEKPSNNT